MSGVILSDGVWTGAKRKQQTSGDPPVNA